MPSQVTSLISDVEKARTELNRVKNPQLHSAKTRASLRGIVERYFNEVRPSIDGTPTASQHIEGVDTAMQAILSLCHKKGRVQKYKGLLRTAKGHLIIWTLASSRGRAGRMATVETPKTSES